MTEDTSTRVSWAARVARVQARRPWWIIAGALVLALASVPFVVKLDINTDWADMLPRSKPSVKDLERVKGRVAGMTTLTLVLQSSDTNALLRFAGDLVPRLKKMDAPKVRSVDWNVSAYEDFVRAHRYLYATVEDLTEVRDAFDDRLQYEKAKANPFFVALGDTPEDPEAVIRRLELKAKEKSGNAKRDRHGYYLHENGKYLVIFLRTDIRGGDVDSAEALIAKVNHEVAALTPAGYAKDLKVEYTGELLTSREEYKAVVTEVFVATSLTFLLVLLAIYALFRRVRSVPLLGLSIVVPTLVTFAVAKLAVHELNTSTAFLGSIVIGNGINPGFNWLARYFEERRAGYEVELAITRTHEGVWLGTFAAAVAASCAYGSLMIAGFRGFRDFGIISSIGMLVCWTGMLTILPALTTVSERFRPLLFKEARTGTVYGSFVWRVVERAPRGVLTVFASLVAVSLVLVTVAVARDPLEYDFRKLRSTGQTTSRASALGKYVSEIAGKAAAGNAIAVLVDRRDDSGPLEEALDRGREKSKQAPYGKVRSIDDLVPPDQGAKIQILGEIRHLMLDVRKFADDKLAKRIDANIPEKFVRPVTVADLPEEVARPFTERDGTRGRILFVESRKGRSVWDGRYLVEWAKAIRAIPLTEGRPAALAGRAPIFADMLEVVVEDGPKAVSLSFVVTVIVVMLTFRRTRDRLYTLGSLLVGIVLMCGSMAALGMKLNFLNFVAFPIAFGNGVDYAVNTMGRYVQDRDGGQVPPVEAIRRAVAETGGAVILCSLTTVIGYISLFTSANQALNSFGGAMAISEVTCLLAAVFAMPALILLRRRRDMQRRASASSASALASGEQDPPKPETADVNAA